MEAITVKMQKPAKDYIDPSGENEPKRNYLLTSFIGDMVSKRFRSDTYRSHFHSLVIHLDRFSFENNCRIYTNSVTEDFLQDFIYYLKECNLRPNTIAGYVGSIKEMVRAAGERGYVINHTYHTVKPKTERSFSVALSMNEITRIMYFERLTLKQKVIRDMFVVGCLTGLRYSDYSMLSVNDIQDGVIVKKTKKTGAIVHIPIHPYIREILSKYNGKFPMERKCLSLSYFNRYIKQIVRKVGIDEMVIFHRTVGFEDVTEVYQKWELIGTHTARRSFATFMYLSGRFTTQQIMAITGHTSERSFFRYIRIDPQVSAQAIAADLFFKI